MEDIEKFEQKLKSFDEAERRKGEARLTRKNNRIMGWVPQRGSTKWVETARFDPAPSGGWFIFGQLALAVYVPKDESSLRVVSRPFALVHFELFHENWRIVLLSGIFGAFFGVFVLSL